MKYMLSVGARSSPGAAAWANPRWLEILQVGEEVWHGCARTDALRKFPLRD